MDKNNDKLFFKIIRNKYLFNIILNNLKIFNNCFILNKNILYKKFQIIKNQNFNNYITFLNLSLIEENENYKYNLKEIKILFPFLEELVLPDKFKEKISIDDFNNNLKSITFGLAFNNDSFSYEVCHGNKVLPESVENIVFGESFEQPICRGSLSENVKSIKLGQYQNCKSLQLPDSVTELTLGLLSSEPLLNNQDFKLPNSLKHLILFSDIEIDEDFLPEGLKILELNEYNRDFKSDKILPSSLEYLKFGNAFNKPLNHVLPKLINLTKLKFSPHFKFPLKVGSLPNTLKNITFGEYASTLTPGILPISLEKIKIKMDMFGFPNYDLLVPGSLPNNKLTTFKISPFCMFNIKANVLPPTIKSLEFSSGYISILNKYSIPSTIEELSIEDSNSIGYEYLENFDQLNQLKKLTINFRENLDIIKHFKLPSNGNLKYLKTDLQTLSNHLPNSIETLKMKFPTLHNQFSYFPNNLKKLKLSSNRNSFINSTEKYSITLSSSLIHLCFINIQINYFDFSNLVNLKTLKISGLNFTSRDIVESQDNNNNKDINLKEIKLNLPTNITSLRISEIHVITNHNLKYTLDLSKNNLNQLKKLEIINYLDFKIKEILFPNSEIEELIINTTYLNSKSINDSNLFSKSLKRISFGSNIKSFNYKSNINYLKSVKEITIDNLFNIPSDFLENFPSLEIINIVYPNIKSNPQMIQIDKIFNIEKIKINFINKIKNKNH